MEFTEEEERYLIALKKRGGRGVSLLARVPDVEHEVDRRGESISPSTTE
jgi:hypothetical protein